MSAKPSKIRLALAITDLAVGGAERCLTNLALHLDPQRFEPQVYCLAPRPEPPRDGLVTQLESAGIPAHFIGARSSFHFYRAVSCLEHLLKKQSPHLLQTFLFHANVVATMAGRRAGVPAMVTGIRVADPLRWRWYAERWLSRAVQKVVCVSQSVADLARSRLALPSEKLVVIPNGINLDEVASRQAASLMPFGIPDAGQVIVAVGRLDPQKGIDWLLRLLPRLFAQVPNGHLLLVGDGPQRKRLQAMTQRLGIGRQVHFAGWRADAMEILASCHVMVLPSRWEGMPNALIEAMASQLPVVATRADGVDEVLGPLTEYQAVDFGDDDRFVSQLAAILLDASLAARLGRDNRQRIATHFCPHQMVSSYQRLYESLV